MTDKINIPRLGLMITRNTTTPGAARIAGNFNGDLGDDAEGVAASDALTSLVLAHHCAGVDVTTDEYVNGVLTALEAVANNY